MALFASLLCKDLWWLPVDKFCQEADPRILGGLGKVLAVRSWALVSPPLETGVVEQLE